MIGWPYIKDGYLVYGKNFKCDVLKVGPRTKQCQFLIYDKLGPQTKVHHPLVITPPSSPCIYPFCMDKQMIANSSLFNSSQGPVSSAELCGADRMVQIYSQPVSALMMEGAVLILV